MRRPSSSVLLVIAVVIVVSCFSMLWVLMDGKSTSGLANLDALHRTEVQNISGKTLTSNGRTAALSNAGDHGALASESSSMANDANASLEALLTKVVAAGSNEIHESNDIEALSALGEIANNNPVVRKKLMQGYSSTRNEMSKRLYKELLVGSATPDVMEFSWQLIDSSDVSQRRDGFELLAALPPSSGMVKRVLQSIGKEKDPLAIRHAVEILGNSATIEPGESKSVVSQLANFTQHKDAEVRAYSILVLSKWDNSGRAIEESTYRALSDNTTEVRQATFGAIALGNVRSDRVKDSLFDIVSNGNEDSATRAGAVEALAQFELSSAEHARYKRAR